MATANGFRRSHFWDYDWKPEGIEAVVRLQASGTPMMAECMGFVLAVYAPDLEWKIRLGTDVDLRGFGTTSLADPVIINPGDRLRWEGVESFVALLAFR